MQQVFVLILAIVVFAGAAAFGPYVTWFVGLLIWAIYGWAFGTLLVEHTAAALTWVAIGVLLAVWLLAMVLAPLIDVAAGTRHPKQ